MKNKHIFAVISLMLIAAIFSGCRSNSRSRAEASQPTNLIPLTFSILQRLGESYGSATIGNYQLVLSGKMDMEREDTYKNHDVIAGMAIIEDEYIREVIIINDQTKGQALRMENRGGMAVISVCFDENETVSFLNFTCRADRENDYFYLDYTVTASALSEERGTLQYGGYTYRLKFTGDRPYLLISLSQKETESLNSRVLSGRVVN